MSVLTACLGWIVGVNDDMKISAKSAKVAAVTPIKIRKKALCVSNKVSACPALERLVAEHVLIFGQYCFIQWSTRPASIIFMILKNEINGIIT